MMARNGGYPSSCRVIRWCPTLDLSRSVAFTTAPEREQAACSISSLGKARKTRIQCPRQPAAICSWRFMISSEHCMRRESQCRATDKLFRRAGNIIKDRFADPDFGPCEAAAEAGISLRYLQKLFTQRGSTCGEFIYSLRLEHAARLLHRRKFLGTGQPVSEIAYACGFRDYTNFARKFRRRFGCSPATHAGDHA